MRINNWTAYSGEEIEKSVEILPEIKINRRTRSKGIPIKDTRNKTGNRSKLAVKMPLQ